jgi:hypothetical protein
MKILPPLILRLITTPALAGGHLHPERWQQEQWCEAMGGQTEVVLPDLGDCAIRPETMKKAPRDEGLN